MLSDKMASLRLSHQLDEATQSNLDCTVHFSRAAAEAYLPPLLDILRTSGVSLSILAWLIRVYCRSWEVSGKSLGWVSGVVGSMTRFISKPPSLSRKQPDGTRAPSIPHSELKNQVSRSKSQSEK